MFPILPITVGAIFLCSTGAQLSPPRPTPSFTSVPVRLEHSARCVALSPDGARVAFGRDDGTIIIWDQRRRKRLHKLQGDEGEVDSVAFSSDGRSLESRTWGKNPKAWENITVSLWEVATGTEVFKLRTPTAGWGLAFSPDHATLALAKWEKTVHLSDPRTGKALRDLDGHDAWVTRLVFSRDGKKLASESQDRAACLWDVATGRQLQQQKWDGQEVADLAFAAADLRVVTTHSTDERGRLTVRVRDLATRKALLEAPLSLAGTFSPDGKYLAAWTGLGPCGGGAFILWNVGTAGAEPLVGGAIGAAGPAVFSADGRVLAAAWGPASQPDSVATVVQLWDVATAEPLVKVGIPGGVRSTYSLDGKNLAFSPDGRMLAIAGAERCVLQNLAGLRGFGGSVSAIALSPDGQLFATGRANGTVQLWEAATGKSVHEFQGHPKEVQALAFSPDGRVLASSGADDTVRTWDVPRGRLRHAHKVYRAAGSVPQLPPGTPAIEVSLVRVFRKALEGGVHALAFSRDSKVLTADTSDYGILRWDVTTGKQVTGYVEEP